MVEGRFEGVLSGGEDDELCICGAKKQTMDGAKLLSSISATLKTRKARRIRTAEPFSCPKSCRILSYFFASVVPQKAGASLCFCSVFLGSSPLFHRCYFAVFGPSVTKFLPSFRGRFFRPGSDVSPMFFSPVLALPRGVLFDLLPCPSV